MHKVQCKGVLLGVLISIVASGCPRPSSEDPPEVSKEDSSSSSSAAVDTPSPTEQTESAKTDSVAADKIGSGEEYTEPSAPGADATSSGQPGSAEPGARGATKGGATGAGVDAGGAGGRPTSAPSGRSDVVGGPTPPRVSAPTFKSPQEARKFAANQRSKAKRQAADGNEAQAYKDALVGWQVLQPHLSDAGCRKLSDQLIADIEKYGEQLSSTGHPVIGKPLKIR